MKSLKGNGSVLIAAATPQLKRNPSDGRPDFRSMRLFASLTLTFAISSCSNQDRFQVPHDVSLRRLQPHVNRP